MKKIMQLLVGTGLLFFITTSVNASTAYGALSNFDAVNDTGVTCHGFEIEIEDVKSTGIGYTYNYNHYGVPTITVDNSNPVKPITHIRYESKKDANGNYTSFTNVPVSALPATQGHQCTNPAVNQGCEHFGVSYAGTANTVVRYHWLIDDPAHPGTLINGAPVLVNTPTWTYSPPAVVNNIQVPAQVVAVIPAPVVPVPPAKQFGAASWVKVIKTTTHNANPVVLEELIGGDKDGDGQADWANQEPAEVETEWYLLQTNNNANGGKLNLPGAAEKLPNGNETVTRRYEFYKYSGSAWTIDGEQGEAMCDAVAADGLHGAQASVGVTNADGSSHQADCTAEIIVGDYTGSNMVGFDAAADLGLIDAIEDGKINVPYVDRTIVNGGDTPYNTAITVGALPAGLAINKVTGILSGKPTEAGVFTFTVEAIDSAVNPVTVSKSYTINIVDPAGPVTLPTISTSALPGGIEAAVYYTTLTATAGTAPYSWSVDALPAGLTLSANGAITGTPAVGTAGTTTPTFTVTDAKAKTHVKSLPLIIAPAPVPPPVISTNVLANGTELAVYSATLTATAGTAPYSWSVNSLPAGLALSANGLLSGTPGAGTAGTTTPTFTVTDAKGVTDTALLALTIAPAPVIACSGANAVITSVGRDFIGVNGGISNGGQNVWYTPTPVGTTFTGGTTTFVNGELVDYAGTADVLGSCHATSMTVKPAPVQPPPPVSCTKPVNAKSFAVSKQKITAVTATTITVGGKVVKTGCATVSWNGAKAFKVGDYAEVSKGFTVNGINTALKITIN